MTCFSFLACVPLDSQLADGVVHKNDKEDGIDYMFECNSGFVMNGSNHVKCEDGVYNGSAPNCLPKGEVNCRFIFINTKERIYFKMVYSRWSALVSIRSLNCTSHHCCPGFLRTI